MTVFIISLIIIINFILQSTAISYFSIFGVVPNTSLIIIVAIALLKGKKVGSTTGLLIGLLQDIVFSSVIGVNAFIYFFIGYLMGMAEDKLSKENILLPVIMSIITTIGYHFFYFLFMFFLNYDISFSIFFKQIVIIEMIYNSLLSIFLFKLFSKIFVMPSITFGKK